MLISICIATYKRPEILKKLLESITKLERNFEIEVIVTDNDPMKSALEVVREFGVKYYVQEKRGITAARNKCLENAAGDFVTFIDDDEYVSKKWLVNLVGSLLKYKADCAFGPAEPIFLNDVAGWKKEFYKRKKATTGMVLKNMRYISTANCIMTKECAKTRFDDKYGLTGGSDMHFFQELLNQGKKIIWCDEAIVNEIIPLNRQTYKYMCKNQRKKGFVKARFILKHNKKVKAIMRVLFLSGAEIGLGIIKSLYYLVTKPTFILLPLVRIPKALGQLKALTKKDYLFYSIERKIGK